jgi:hypothetical protein
MILYKYIYIYIYVYIIYIAQFLLELEMFQTEFIEKVKTHILCSGTNLPENQAIY